MSTIFQIQIIAILISIASGIIGVFLILKKMSMLSDSITHTILLGIVIAYFITKDLNSPLLIIGATIMGVITVWLTQRISNIDLVSDESAIGLVFPFLFSIAVILISKFGSNIHLDIDSVLLGELSFAPFNRLVVMGIDIGAKAIYISVIVLILNVIYIKLFFKELKLTIFDPTLAMTLGISTTYINYSLMTMVSLTTVVAFEVVGTVLVVAFMIGPPVTAYLLTDDLKNMLRLSCLFSAISSILGLQIALFFDISISGCMASMVGVIFLLVYFVKVIVFKRNKSL